MTGVPRTGIVGRLGALSPWARAGWIAGAAGTVVLAAAQPIAYHLGVYGSDNRPVTVAGLAVITAGRTAAAIGGLAAWARRPDSRIGAVLVLWALLSLSSGIGVHVSGALLAWTNLSTVLTRVLIAYVLLTYPDGRPETRPERLFLRWILAVPVIRLGFILVTPPPGLDSSCATVHCPGNPLLLVGSAAASQALLRVQYAAAAAGALCLLVLLTHRFRRTPPSRRRATRPVLWAATALIVVYLIKIVLDATHTTDPAARWALYWTDHLTIFWLPLAMIAGLLASRLARADVAALLITLRSAPVDELQPGLAQVLGDPHAQIAIPVTEPAPGYVDPNGRPVHLPADPAARTAIGDGILLLHHPTTRTEDPHLFDAAVAAAGLTLDNVRLAAQVRAQLAEVNASRERILRAGDEERRRLERDLHDGAQQRLIGLGMALRSARESLDDHSPAARLVDDATDQLRHSLTELRDLARGLRPALLTERGLATAVQSLLLHVPVPATLTADLSTRPDPAVETAAFFVIAEALQNITRHAPAAHATITLRVHDNLLRVTVADDGPGGADDRAGTGLRGITDRVAATGGRLTITSDPGRGTSITAELPMRGQVDVQR